MRWFKKKKVKTMNRDHLLASYYAMSDKEYIQWLRQFDLQFSGMIG